MPIKDGLILCGCLLDNATHTDMLKEIYHLLRNKKGK